jgi:hypothetical protein
MTEQTIILDPYEWAHAKQVGTARDESSKAKGQQGRAGQSPDRSLQNHIDGAAAELAVCIALGLPWSANIDTYLNEPDVEVPLLGGVEVNIPRATLKGSASTGQSLMPEGLEAGLDVQGMADLLTFIEELK